MAKKPCLGIGGNETPPPWGGEAGSRRPSGSSFGAKRQQRLRWRASRGQRRETLPVPAPHGAAQLFSRMGDEVVELYRDQGGHQRGPRADRLHGDATRRRFDVVMAWSVDRLGMVPTGISTDVPDCLLRTVRYALACLSNRTTWPPSPCACCTSRLDPPPLKWSDLNYVF